MSQTASEKILADACGESTVSANDTVEVEVDLTWVHETQLEIFRNKFEEFGGDVWDRDKAIFMIDHFPNAATQDQANRLQMLREYAEEKDVELVKVGIKHQAWRMLGRAFPGAIMAGPDSHTPTAGALGAFAVCVGPTDTAIIWNSGNFWINVPETLLFEIEGQLDPFVTPRDVGFHILERFRDKSDYFADGMTVEFTGDTIAQMGLDGRQTLCNMTTEMGAVTSYIEPDDTLTSEYLEPKVDADYTIHHTDEEADSVTAHTIDVNSLQPKVAYPHSPSNAHDIDEAEGIKLDRLFLGSCANGHLDDLRMAAEILDGQEIHPDVELIVTPATDEIRKQASTEGILDVFFQANARVSSGYCSVCPGYEGILSENEVCLSTNTRNYQGRMGHPSSDIYLSSPAVLAASAITGEITDPRTVAS